MRISSSQKLVAALTGPGGGDAHGCAWRREEQQQQQQPGWSPPLASAAGLALSGGGLLGAQQGECGETGGARRWLAAESSQGPAACVGWGVAVSPAQAASIVASAVHAQALLVRRSLQAPAPGGTGAPPCAPPCTPPCAQATAAPALPQPPAHAERAHLPDTQGQPSPCLAPAPATPGPPDPPPRRRVDPLTLGALRAPGAAAPAVPPLPPLPPPAAPHRRTWGHSGGAGCGSGRGPPSPARGCGSQRPAPAALGGPGAGLGLGVAGQGAMGVDALLARLLSSQATAARLLPAGGRARPAQRTTVPELRAGPAPGAPEAQGAGVGSGTGSQALRPLAREEAKPPLPPRGRAAGHSALQHARARHESAAAEARQP
jgi:hypothetical protein